MKCNAEVNSDHKLSFTSYCYTTIYTIRMFNYMYLDRYYCQIELLLLRESNFPLCLYVNNLHHSSLFAETGISQPSCLLCSLSLIRSHLVFDILVESFSMNISYYTMIFREPKEFVASFSTLGMGCKSFSSYFSQNNHYSFYNRDSNPDSLTRQNQKRSAWIFETVVCPGFQNVFYTIWNVQASSLSHSRSHSKYQFSWSIFKGKIKHLVCSGGNTKTYTAWAYPQRPQIRDICDIKNHRNVFFIGI